MLKLILFKKFLNINYYNKSFIRQILATEENGSHMFLADTYSSWEKLIPHALKQKKLKKLTSCLDGSSKIIQPFIYANKSIDDWRFKASIQTRSSIDKNFVKNLQLALKSISGTNTLLKTFLFLMAKKGGFRVYSTGLLGFMPRSQALILFNKCNLCFNLVIAKRHLFAFDLFHRLHAISTKIPTIIRCPFFQVKKTLYVQWEKKKKKKLWGKKAQKRYNQLINIVFLLKKKLRKGKGIRWGKKKLKKKKKKKNYGKKKIKIYNKPAPCFK